MMFPAYPAYKDSGVEWLGDVPESWAVTLLKRGYEVVLGKMLQPEAKRDDDEFLPYLRAANIQVSGVDAVDVKKMWFSVGEKKSLLLRRGDLLVSEGGDVGRPAIWDFDEEFYFQNSINRIRSIAGNDTRFLYFWMITIKNNGYIDVLCNKSTIAHFTAEKVAAVPLPIPSKHEQTQIARFLDHETACIDALIEEQQRLIELLKEKRQAVISHAVTKGLDPKVPMKYSGVEWLGEVPAHWEVCALMNLTAPGRAIMYGIVLPGENVEDGIPIVKGGDVKPSRLVLDSLCRTTREIEASFARARLKPKDIVYSIRGTIGDAELVPDDFVHVNITQDVARISPHDDIDSDWLLYAMRSKPVFVQLEQRSLGAAVRGINIFDLKRAKIPVPPALERVRIAEFIRLEASKLDELMLEASRGIGLLQERRSALISAAVTGKIDVRDWQPPASAQAPELAVAEAD